MATVILIFVSIFFIVHNVCTGVEERKQIFEDVAPPEKIIECVSKISPDISEVHKMALRYARLAPEDISRWKKNIKWSAALPRLQFGYERRLADAVAVGVQDSVSVTSAGSTVGPAASDMNQSFDRNNNIEVTLVWYLDELLFNRDELSISGEARSQINARREMLGEITDDYYELLRLVAIQKMRREAQRGGVLRLEIDRLAGRIGGFTGGWFAETFNWKEARCE